MRASLKMKKINLLLCLCLLFTSSFGDGTKQEKDNNSEEIIGEQNSKQTKCQENDEKDCDIDYMNSNETGPLDSHEAMNTREFKARNKRSIQVDKKAFRNMLLGRVHKKSKDMREEAPEIDAEPQKFQEDASELLLELLVRIAAHPQQWNDVHALLQKIDSDIVTSKKIITDLEKPQESTIGTNIITAGTDKIENNTERNSSTADDVQKLIILLGNEKQNNFSRNSWPNLDDNNTNSSEDLEESYQNFERLSKDQTATTQNIFSWANKPSMKNTTREFEFAYHRVTGQPLPYRSNYDKARARNAYIAVSVIGPKSRDVPLEKQDNLLEDELRQLKPWSREENLSKMENIPRKWIFQSHMHKNSNAESP